MAKISLRMYNREIEGLIEHGQQLDEAIAHCRQILKSYPKHLETYRLLGKAYLEAKRYDQAVDIFQRVLVAAPDDFVSHVGMSIIADDKGKLDDAIWHMERAFEVQPSNAAIQGELQRLFGRRDGMEPPKIRLTRGALAHMYVQGELYNQAISEIRAVLASDPKRTDMQTLLAKAYFRHGQKTEAADICTELLARFPYCLDANRLMVEILPGTQRAESAQEYRGRVIELDPYSAFTQDSMFHSENVGDSAVSLERLEYMGEPGEFTGTLGIGLESDTAAAGRSLPQDRQHPGENAAEDFRTEEVGGDLPSWLRGTADDATARGPAGPASASPSQNKDDLPEFLRQAGWGSSAIQTPETESAFGQGSTQPAEDAAIEGDLPEWVKALAPSDDKESTSRPSVPSPESDMMSSLGTGSFSADTPDWLRNLGGEEPVQPSTLPESLRPSTESPSTLPADAPDWLRNLGAEEASPPAPPVVESAAHTPEPPSFSDDTPDWLRSLAAEEPAQPAIPTPDMPASTTGTPSTFQTDTSDWLRSLDAEEPASQVPSTPEIPTPAAETPSTLPADTPDWLRKLEAEPPSDVAPPAAAEPAEETPDWMKGLAGRELDEPAVPTKAAGESDWLGGLRAEQEAAVLPEPVPDETPDWLKDFNNDLETPITKVATPEPAAPKPINVEPASTLGSLGTTAQEQDDAMAWLEGLAAKHGAKPEELVTDPNARTEVAPDWVDKAKEIGEQAQEPPQAVAETPAPAPAAPSTDETGMWLRSLEAEETVAPKAEQPEPPAEAPSDIRSELTDENAFAGMEAEPEKEEPPIMGERETPEWFTDFERKPTQRLNLDDAPDWLRGVSRESAEPESAAPEEAVEPSTSEAGLPSESVSASYAEASQAESEISDLPAWLAGLDAEDSQITSPGVRQSTSDDLPAWLQSEVEPEPQATEPANPADWRPVQTESMKAEPPVVEPEPLMEQPVPAEEPAPEPPPAPKPLERAPVSRPVPTRAKPVGVAAKTVTLSIGDAQSQLGRGNIAAALDIYTKLIRKGKSLEEIIRDLRDALYRYPVEVPLWQSLGDAYMRANRLQEALDAYTKAEELLR